MTSVQAELIIRIESAFANVRLGDGASLNMAEYFDSGGCAPKYAELAKKDERDDWARIPDSELETFRVTFCFTDLLGYRFYAAPYMSWTIRNHRISDNFIADATIYAMDPNRFQFEVTKFTRWFTPEQIDAILGFLDYCTKNDDSLDGRIAEENALKIRAELGRYVGG